VISQFVAKDCRPFIKSIEIHIKGINHALRLFDDNDNYSDGVLSPQSLEVWSLAMEIVWPVI
jgi:hypothetical protein